MRRPVRFTPLLLAVLLTPTCDEDPLSLEERTAGNFEAVVWTITSSTLSFDILARGGHLRLELTPHGATSGEFFIPANSAPEPNEQRLDLAGEWYIDDGVVVFDMPADTYLNFTAWEIFPGELRSRFSNGPWTVQTVLRKRSESD